MGSSAVFNAHDELPCGCMLWHDNIGGANGLSPCPLHAAAPDLLAALQKSERFLSVLALALREGVVKGLATTWPAELTACVDEGRAAIAKARGGANG